MHQGAKNCVTSFIEICFIIVVWNQTHNSSEISLYTWFLSQIPYCKDTQYAVVLISTYPKEKAFSLLTLLELYFLVIFHSFQWLKFEYFTSSISPSVLITLTSLVSQMIKSLPPMLETWVQSLSQEEPLEKGKATHSSILASRIPCEEEPGQLQSMGQQRVGHN